MSYLLLPEDELDLVRHITEDLGLLMVSAAHLMHGRIQVDRAPLTSLPEPLPKSPDPRREFTWQYVFWSPSWGPARSMGDVADTYDWKTRALASDILLEDSDWMNRIDPSSPLLVWDRCHWHDGQLGVGRLGATPTPARIQPPPLVSAPRRCERWLQRGGVRLDRTEFDLPRWPAVWARPAAWEWIRGGGRLWLAAL